jgi:MarR-like DNA-binding transcriptional regulator SgrR of sgrS sRNA
MNRGPFDKLRVNGVKLRASGILLVLLATTASLAAGRARYGGTLQVVVAGKMTEADPLYADAPLEAALISLVASPMCRLDAHQRIEAALAQDFTGGFTSIEIRLSPATRGDGKPLTAQDAAAALRRALTEPTPYRGLLLPLETTNSVGAIGTDRVAFKLAFPWPDLGAALCHPSLALSQSPRTDGAGPFAAQSGQGSYLPQSAYPRGRPYVDALRLSSSDARGAARQVAQRKAHLALGIAPADAPPPPALSATYLLFSPEKAGAAVRGALEKAVDRDDLTRFFAVRAPTVPMNGLLPPLLQPDAKLPPPAAVASAQKPLTLKWDQSIEDHRAVAERLQVKLQDLGYRVALEPVSRRALREAWAKGDYSLMLQQVLLPPVPAPALAVVATLARAPNAAARLKPLGALADARERADKARALASELATELHLLPLYAQGLALQPAAGLQQLSLDGFGLPRLDDVFLEASP